jgi:hypothetical protein
MHKLIVVAIGIPAFFAMLTAVAVLGTLTAAR